MRENAKMLLFFYWRGRAFFKDHPVTVPVTVYFQNVAADSKLHTKNIDFLQKQELNITLKLAKKSIGAMDSMIKWEL